MNQKDIKLLWGRAASRCSICQIELSQDASATNASFLLGEQAHIVGETENSPRGESLLELTERNSYHNLILLCPNHHTEVDKSVPDWPVERLYLTKSRHELWVNESLGQPRDARTEANGLAVASVIDAAVDGCNFANWNNWVGSAYGYSAWRHADGFDFFGFRTKVATTIWADEFDELRRASFTLSIQLLQYDNSFMEYADVRDDIYVADKFYKRRGEFNPNYHQDVEIYLAWVDEFSSLLIESTKAANWFSDVVRRDVNPMFFVEYGKFRVYQGLGTDFKTHLVIPQFTQEERNSLPESLLS